MPGATVSVACKLPNGMHLNIFAMEPHFEPVMGGGKRETKMARFLGRVTVKGTGRPILDDPRVVGGYAVTPNVDADVWAKWLEQNADAEVVKKGLIFALPKHGDIANEAQSRRTLTSGLEPIDPKNLPPEFKRKIETADRA